MLVDLKCRKIVCDVCGRTLGDDADFVPHLTEGEAQTEADLLDGEDWTVWKDEHWCPSCSPPCVCDHYFGGHDYGEAGCENCDCPEYRRKEAEDAES